MSSNQKGMRKTKIGSVIGNKMNKTVVVNVENTMRHPKYGKVIKNRKKYYAHHEGETLDLGTKVQIEESKPYSKLKRWRVVSEQTKIEGIAQE